MDAPRHAIIQKYSQERQYILAHGVHDGRGRCQYSTRKEEKNLTHSMENKCAIKTSVCVGLFFYFIFLVLIAVSPLFLPKPIIIVSLRKGKRRLI